MSDQPAYESPVPTPDTSAAMPQAAEGSLGTSSEPTSTSSAAPTQSNGGAPEPEETHAATLPAVQDAGTSPTSAAEKQGDAASTAPPSAASVSAETSSASASIGEKPRPPARSLASAAATAEEREALKRAELEALDQEIESELKAAFAEAEKAQTTALAQSDEAKFKRPRTEPATRKGVILAITSTDVFVDIGGRTQGVLPLEQFPDSAPRVGQEVEVAIKGYDEENGLVLLERPGIALIKANWASLQVGAIVEARVTAAIKGGLEVEVNGIRGFIPASQVDFQRVEDLAPYVGQRFACQVIEANPEENTLVLSRRAVVEKERLQVQEQLWQELAEGQVRTGIVRSVQDYGAFVDLGHGVEGLLHVSEMSWGRRVQASELLRPGQEVRVAIIRLDRQNKRIGLSLKQVQGDPWNTVEDRYPVGTIVTGKVTRLAEFGAFVELEPGLEGLVHISELSPQRVRRVEDAVQIGQEVRAQVIKVDRAARKLSLSIKAVQAAEEEEFTPVPARRTASTQRRRPLKGGLD
ncbi:30S ribosomal protein S1 [bacterium HR36]|nr:30S ribosomal protein S1 [bacterium HR36]